MASASSLLSSSSQAGKCVTVRASLDIAHCLESKYLKPEENCQVYGKCNRRGGHGHRWTVSITAKNISERDLAQLVKEAIEDNFDHRNLNLEESCPHMAGIVPTVENFAYVSMALLKEAFVKAQRNPFDLVRIRVFETRTGSTVWDPTPEDIERLCVGKYDCIQQTTPDTPVMRIAKRIEIWHEEDSIPVDSGDSALWRVEGPGAGMSNNAVCLDLVASSPLNTRKGMIENLCTIKDIITSAYRTWKSANSANAKLHPRNMGVDDLRQILQLCVTDATKRRDSDEIYADLNPDIIYGLHWEHEYAVQNPRDGTVQSVIRQFSVHRSDL